MKKFFKTELIKWNNQSNKRTMPWKGQKDAYKIWLSEVILQQTRVQQGLSYYNKFVQLYPHISDLAMASDDEVFKAWEGLGYYSRCRNLLHTARTVVKQHSGLFPQTYHEILQLKGIGPYTAAAITSFAYNLPYAVLDGNVYRVLSRFFGLSVPIDTLPGKKIFTELAQDCLDKADPASYNQAIMDFGAEICKPQNPICNQCPISNYCVAYKKQLVHLLPVKEKQLIKRNRWFTYFIFCFEDKVFIKQRAANDIWQQLYEFYLLEVSKETVCTRQNICRWMNQLEIDNFEIVYVSPVYKQTLTHQKISAQFVEIDLKAIPAILNADLFKPKAEISGLAFPVIINQFINSRFVN